MEPNGHLLFMTSQVSHLRGGCLNCSAVSHQLITVDDIFKQSGYYTLWIESWNPTKNISAGPRIQGWSSFRNVHGYLSARLYPLLLFYGVSGLLYLVLGLCWLALMACHYRDLLRLQFWIGVVILIGMMHMAFAFGNLDYLNERGVTLGFLTVVAELLLALKDTLARLLILVVSMGFGVVKPRLDGVQRQIATVGVAYFLFDLVYSISHSMERTTFSPSSTDDIVVIPLSALNAGIFYWIFASLHHTIKILEIRRNIVKLQMYTRFRAILTAAVAASLLFLVWLASDRFGAILPRGEDWRHDWWQEGFWDMLFLAILLAIVVLWRPTTNNARFAYAPLETGDDEDDEVGRVQPTFSAESMKMRTLASSRSHTPVPATNETDEDLRWVEENIPSASLRDTAFPANPLDSDEEIMTRRLELSKLE